MKILLTNDDGITAKGLLVAFHALSRDYEVMVIAPDRERSAVGHAITLNLPIRAEKKYLLPDHWGYAVSGTPVDCIKLGLLELLPEKPDLVISGINPGANTGVNLNYSGTVAAAKEACLYGIPSIAASIQGHEPMHFEAAAAVLLKLIRKVLATGLPAGTFLNINFPDLPRKQIAGIRISNQDLRFYKEYIEKKKDPRNRIYYWHGMEMKPAEPDDKADTPLLDQNYISITPIKCDMTDYHLMKELRTLEKDGLLIE